MEGVITQDVSALLERKEQVRACIDLVRPEIARYNRYPIRDYSAYGRAVTPRTVAFELSNLWRFFTGGSNMFNPSLLLPLYYSESRPDYRYFRFMIRTQPSDLGGLPPKIRQNLDLFREAGLVSEQDGQYRFNYRIVDLDGLLLVTDTYSLRKDMVWLSSDSLATVRLMARVLRQSPPPAGKRSLSVLDLCCGNAVVGLYAARALAGRQTHLSGLDINERAIILARLNAWLNGLEDTDWIADSIHDHAFQRPFDLIVANPAYGSSSFEAKRLCHWAGETGIEQVLAIFRHIEQSLAEDGRFLVMSTSPVQGGVPMLLEKMAQTQAGRFDLTYEALDTYDTTAMNVANNAYPVRQKAILYGTVNRAGTGRVRMLKNRWFTLSHRF